MQLPAHFGKYELLERIAVGGMAEVFLARSFGVAGFEKRLVVKRLRHELAQDPRFVAMFIAEAKIGVNLNHPNIVQVYELGKVQALHYIAMEFLHGRDLTRVVKALRAREQRVPAPLAVAILAEVCRGLAYAHGRTGPDGAPLGLVHRDVSPHNVVVTFNGDVKLVDFGIARLVPLVPGSVEPKPGPGGGKFAYMSPEQAVGHSLDHRSDVFSTGIVLWELLAGRRMYQDDDPVEKLRKVRDAIVPEMSCAGVDDGLRAILSAALARDPADRYAAASAMEEDLRAWLFERRHRVGRTEIATFLQEVFPEDADRTSEEDLQLRRLMADVDRMDASDPSLEPSGEAEKRGRVQGGGGGRRPVVVVMVDVDGLTELSARVEPEVLVRRKYQLLRWTRRIVDRHGGLVAHAVDDHITVLFGVPRTRNDDLAHALECALELQRNVGQLRKKGMSLDLAIGVHTGEVSVSRVGRRVRYVARGDTTRLARKLSAVADHGQVLASERVLNSVQGWFRVRHGPQILSRGGRPAASSYLVDGRTHGLRGTQAGAWVRRGEELDVLRTSLATVSDGGSATVVLVGRGGSGKSRFIREIRDLATRRGTMFLGVRCTALGTEHPLEPLRDLVALVLGRDPEASVAELVAAADRFQQLGLTERDQTAIVSLLGGKTAHTAERSETWAAIGQILRGLAVDRNLIVALDDAHLLPTSSLPDLAHLVRSTRELPILFLFGVRDPPPAAYRPLGRVVFLGPIRRELLPRFVEGRLGVSEVDPALVALLDRTCEGNALYLEEMLKYLLGSHHVVIEGDRATLAGDGELGLPVTLQALITARIDALDTGSRGLLQLAAIMGPSFDAAVLAEAAGIPDPTPGLLDLAAHGLLVREPIHDALGGGPSEWTFTSALVREAAHRGTLGIQRRDYHRLVAGGIEKVYAGRLDGHLDALVVHTAEGGRIIDAARYAHQAGLRYERAGDFERAKARYEQGLTYLTKAAQSADDWDARVQGEATFHLRLGVVLQALENGAEGQRRLLLALDAAAEGGLPWIEARAHVELGRSYLHQGRHGLAAAHLQQARQSLRVEADPEVEREATEFSALLAFEEGRNEEAETLWQRTLALAGGEPGLVARCEIGLASRYLRAGELDRAGDLLESALGASRTAGDRIMEGRVLQLLGTVHEWAARYPDALRYYRSAIEIREGIGFQRGVVLDHQSIGEVHLLTGEHARAAVRFERSKQTAEQIGWQLGVALADMYLAYLDARSGSGSVEALLAAVRRARGLGDPKVGVTGSWLVGRALIAEARGDEAAPHLDEALIEARRSQHLPLVQRLEASLAAIRSLATA